MLLWFGSEHFRKHEEQKLPNICCSCSGADLRVFGVSCPLFCCFVSEVIGSHPPHPLNTVFGRVREVKGGWKKEAQDYLCCRILVWA